GKRSGGGIEAGLGGRGGRHGRGCWLRMSIRRLLGALFWAGVGSSWFAADSRPDVSQIITKTEAAAILNEPVKDPTPRNGEGQDGYYSKCNYYTVNRGKSLIIRLQVPGPNAIGPQRELQLL